MEKSIEYIQSLSKKYTEYLNNTQVLIDDLHSTDKKIINDLVETYRPKKNEKLTPVNLLRYEVYQRIQNNQKINEREILSIKKKISNKDVEFLKDFPKKKYEHFKSKSFRSWKLFSIFYSAFYTDIVKEKTLEALETICKGIKEQLKLPDLKFSFFGFDGAQNFGSNYSWLALYPKNKMSHKNAYQIFLRFDGDQFTYCIMPGTMVRTKKKEVLFKTEKIADAITYFDEKKDEFIQQNETSINIWKFSPGSQADHWDEFKSKGIMAISFKDSNVRSLDTYSSTEELAEDIGLSSESDRHSSNIIWNLESFRDANIGDIVVANQGRKTCLGVGIINGKYEYDKNKKEYKHIRKVEWVIDSKLLFEKIVFRMDTFSPTLRWSKIKEGYVEKYPDLKEQLDQLEMGKEIEVPPEPEGEDTDANYWWLNANPKMWKIDDYDVDDTIEFTVFNDKGNKRRIFEHFQNVMPGDKVIGYQTSPIKQITSLIEISRSKYQSDDGGEQAIEFVVKEFLEEPVDYSIIKNNETLKNCEPVVNNQGTLFKLKENEYEEIIDIIAEMNPTNRITKNGIGFEALTLESASAKCGVSEASFKDYIELLKENKQIVFQGAPGTGKSHIAKIIRDYLTKGDSSNADIVQFHPSYSYEDFVEGYRPTETGGLILKSGIFKKICHKAKLSKKETVLIIDEINRGDLSKIFGELLYLLEYRDEKVSLTYSPEIPFEIPDNLYIIGTMNTADRSLALIDYALRRRFSFIYLETNYSVIESHLDEAKVDVKVLIENIKKLNEQITSTPSLGRDFQIGHSYFLKDKALSLEGLAHIWKFNLEPLLNEYYFDNTNEVENLKDVLFRGIN